MSGLKFNGYPKVGFRTYGAWGHATMDRDLCRLYSVDKLHNRWVDYNRFLPAEEKIDVSFRQKVTAFSIDNFVKLFDPPLPNHIKIDVDSTELEILEGAQELLKNEEVKSILVEAYLGPEYSDANEIKIKGLLKNLGFKASLRTDNLKTGNLIFLR